MRTLARLALVLLEAALFLALALLALVLSLQAGAPTKFIYYNF